MESFQISWADLIALKNKKSLVKMLDQGGYFIDQSMKLEDLIYNMQQKTRLIKFKKSTSEVVHQACSFLFHL